MSVFQLAHPLSLNNLGVNIVLILCLSQSNAFRWWGDVWAIGGQLRYWHKGSNCRGRGSAVSLQRLIVGTRQCCVLYIMSE